MVGSMAASTIAPTGAPTPSVTTVPHTGPQSSVSAPSKGSANRLVALDGLRFAAAAAVLLYHFTATSSASGYWEATGPQAFPLLNPVTRYGWLAVELFFVISGFVIL